MILGLVGKVKGDNAAKTDESISRMKTGAMSLIELIKNQPPFQQPGAAPNPKTHPELYTSYPLQLPYAVIVYITSVPLVWL